MLQLPLLVVLLVVGGTAHARLLETDDLVLVTSRQLLQANGRAADNTTKPIVKLPKCNLNNATLPDVCDGPEKTKVVNLPTAQGVTRPCLRPIACSY
jgi:hypothetical protein